MSTTSSPTVSPRTKNFTSILHELRKIRTFKQQMEDMQIRQDRSHNRRQSIHDKAKGGEEGGERRNEEENQRERRRDDQVEGVQIKVPKFMGMNNPEAYLNGDED
ncbi:hypothetical protein Lal_00045173 [Lupinus albus]|nr:hypothetical protein Lal_00045173 [Lupinus albus]